MSPGSTKKKPRSRRGALVDNIRAISRDALINTAINGTSSGPQSRDMNKECGYPEEVILDDIVKLYDREGVAKRVVQVYCVETWKNHPEVYETEDTEITEFEKAVNETITRYNLWSVLERADILSGIGYFGVILLGINDGRKLDQPVAGVDLKDPIDMESYKVQPGKKKHELSYIRCFDQRQVTIDTVETDETNPRYGRPTMYTIKFSSIDENGQVTTASMKEAKVHWHRIIHLADNRESSDIIGVPRLRPAYNRIHDLLKVIGGSGEMFWRGGFPGLSFEVQPGLQLAGVQGTDFDVESFRDEVDRYANGLQRYLRLIGLTAKSLAPQVADPTPHVHTGLDQVCITINCPKRIFLGTESAHLASTQDQKTWADRINGRRENYAVPCIIRPVFQRLITFGILPFVENFLTHWRDPEEVDPLIRAQAFEKLVNGMAQYVSSGIATLIPPMQFLTEFLLLDTALAERIVTAALEEAKKPEGEKIALVQATAEQDMQKQQMEQAATIADKTLAAKSQQDKAGVATKAGPNGRKAGTGKKREVKDVSTGQNGG